jgi:hypothetical protein
VISFYFVILYILFLKIAEIDTNFKDFVLAHSLVSFIRLRLLPSATHIMNKTSISATMTQANIDAVKAAIVTIGLQMPFLLSLSEEERRALTKVGPKSVDFVQEAHNASVNFPGILPAVFDKVEYGKDTALFKALGEIKLLINSLNEKVNSTYMAVGAESMNGSLTVYELVRSASKNAPGLKSVSEELSKRFKGQGKRASKKKPADNEGTAA